LRCHAITVQASRCGAPLSSPAKYGRPNPKEPVSGRQTHAMLLGPALEDENLMTQGKDFCLQCNSRPERIAEADEQGNQDREHRQEAYRCPALSAISTARIEFLVGTRGLRRKMCTRKVAYPSCEHAKAALRRIRGLYPSDEWQIPYHCRWCGHWHNGHAPGYVRRAILERQTRW
jgi:hypothetical protein